VSSGVTFYDYREARDYQERLAQEGINSHFEKRQGTYVVTPKEKTKITMRTGTEEELGGSEYAGVQYGYKSGEHEILVRPKASTKVRLHEIGHAVSGHEVIGGRTTAITIDRELDAEIYAWEQKGKTPNYRVGADVLRQLCREAKSWGRVRSLINEVSRKMEERGITVTREDKGELVDFIYDKTDDPEVEAAKEQLKESFY